VNLQPLTQIDSSLKEVLALVFGRSGAGKTEHIRRRLAALVSAFGRVVVLDPRGQWGARSGPAELGEWFLRGGDGLAVCRAFTDAERRAAVRLCWMFGHCVVVFDEFQLYGYAGGYYDQATKLIWTEGRSFGIRSIAITQRPTMIPTVTRFNLSDIVAFQSPVDKGLAWISDAWPGLDAGRIPGLDADRFEFIHAGPNGSILGGLP
jgi:hypothetical protein